ncbi:hypothetical protein [Botrimarina hoheduenensis]|uniref:Uncharacterized protein n=1 Tax=Botrimarina hoheduenensis TaxID=2528000 RepID=A0A5C5WB18_9BACT|nr:hypothetical protein [Botrimarina hoheduenensis]TWT47707.1 hypothetical protein Pla111_13270 [Botrimarina hoheduenensis]
MAVAVLLAFHVNVYQLPESAVAGPIRPLRGAERRTMTGPNGGPPLFLATMPATFDQMQLRLAELPQCDCEPDGFFLLTGRTSDGYFWRLSGHMQEYLPEESATPRMHRVELNGECPAGFLDMVLRTMGWPDATLAFELVQEGVTLGEDDFRRYAASAEAV